ncbi:MAG: PLP-dependent aminotransferase family protein [Hyphomicrobiaceae bacterium]
MNVVRASVWLPNLTRRNGPLYLRIAEALAEARARGDLQPGDRLPSQRDLAKRLGVDLTTVSRAFAEARRRNHIDAAPGRGTFVTLGGPEEPILDLSMNIPPAPAGLSLPTLIREGTDGLLKRSSADALLSYHPGPGSPAERAAGSVWLSTSADRLPIDRIAVGAGAQTLLAAVLTSRAREGDVLLTDELTYPGVIALAQAMKRRLVSIETDDSGMCPDRLAKAARAHDARLVYLNPCLHNPTTLVVPENRRRELIKVARRLQLTIIEDDPYSPLLSERVPSFLSLAPDITFHVATLAKSVSPFLRTAFLVAPDAETLEAITNQLRSLSLMAPPLMTALAAEWIRSGTADEIAEGVRRESAKRQALAAKLLPVNDRGGEGFHIWLPLVSGQNATDIVEKARQQGLAVSGAQEFAATSQAPEAIRVAIGAISDRKQLERAFRSLAGILKPPAKSKATVV